MPYKKTRLKETEGFVLKKLKSADIKNKEIYNQIFLTKKTHSNLNLRYTYFITFILNIVSSPDIEVEGLIYSIRQCPSQ